MINLVRMEFFENFFKTIVITNGTDDSFKVQIWIITIKFLLNFVGVVFVNVENNQKFWISLGDLNYYRDTLSEIASQASDYVRDAIEQLGTGRGVTAMREAAIEALQMSIGLHGEMAQAFARYADATGDRGYRERVPGIADAMLGLFTDDGRGSCAWVYPNRVNGQPARFADPLANDQDWALVFYLWSREHEHE